MIERIIHNLAYFGIKGSLLNWFYDYLCYGRRRVVIDGTSCSWVEISGGVIQGSILGPLLFPLIYINDIVSEIQTDISLFTDDIYRYKIIIENPFIAAQILNNDLKTIHDWS